MRPVQRDHVTYLHFNVLFCRINKFTVQYKTIVSYYKLVSHTTFCLERVFFFSNYAFSQKIVSPNFLFLTERDWDESICTSELCRTEGGIFGNSKNSQNRLKKLPGKV